MLCLGLIPLTSYITSGFSKDINSKSVEILSYCPPINIKKKKSNYTQTKNLYQYIISHKAPNIILTPELFYVDLYPNQLKNSELSFFYNRIFELKPKSVFFIGTEINNSSIIKFNGMSVISKDTILFRTKKKYVPITEYTTALLRPYFGETYYFKNSIDDGNKIKKDTKIFPFVCYESLFSYFFARNSLNTKIIFLSTSEAFLKKSTFAKMQYLNIIRIRAIETGRYIVKCSYDGTSCVINPEGVITQYINNEFEIIKVPEITNNTIYQKIISIF